MSRYTTPIIKLFLAICFLSIFTYCSAQTNPAPQQKGQDKGFTVSAALALPIGDFSSTHFLGISTDIAPSAHNVSLFKKPKIGFTYNAGIAYYFGKKETVSTYPYQYPGFLFIHAFAGAIYIPARSFDIKLTAGPALGIYDGNTNLNIGGKLETAYHLNAAVAIGPGIILMKEPGTTSLWSLALKASLAL